MCCPGEEKNLIGTHRTVRPRLLLADAWNMPRQVSSTASAPSAGARAGCTHITGAFGCHTAAMASASALPMGMAQMPHAAALGMAQGAAYPPNLAPNMMYANMTPAQLMHMQALKTALLGVLGSEEGARLKWRPWGTNNQVLAECVHVHVHVNACTCSMRTCTRTRART